jgi:predicted ArsR family transcriptional regulator
MGDRILELLGSVGALDDDELASRLGIVRQQVNQTCRVLETRASFAASRDGGARS